MHYSWGWATTCDSLLDGSSEEYSINRNRKLTIHLVLHAHIVVVVHDVGIVARPLSFRELEPELARYLFTIFQQTGGRNTINSLCSYLQLKSSWNLTDSFLKQFSVCQLTISHPRSPSIRMFYTRLRWTACGITRPEYPKFRIFLSSFIIIWIIVYSMLNCIRAYEKSLNI